MLTLSSVVIVIVIAVHSTAAFARLLKIVSFKQHTNDILAKWLRLKHTL